MVKRTMNGQIPDFQAIDRLACMFTSPRFLISKSYSSFDPSQGIVSIKVLLGSAIGKT